MIEPEMKLYGWEAMRTTMAGFEKQYAQKLKGWLRASLELIRWRASSKLTQRFLIFRISDRQAIGATGGGRASGHLAQSMATEITSDSIDNLSGRAGTNVEYGKYVEFGSKKGRHFVPFVSHGKDTGLLKWAEDHGLQVYGKNGQLIRHGVMVSGKPIPFLTPALTESKEEIWRNLQTVAQL